MVSLYTWQAVRCTCQPHCSLQEGLDGSERREEGYEDLHWRHG